MKCDDRWKVTAFLLAYCCCAATVHGQDNQHDPYNQPNTNQPDTFNQNNPANRNDPYNAYGDNANNYDAIGNRNQNPSYEPTPDGNYDGNDPYGPRPNWRPNLYDSNSQWNNQYEDGPSSIIREA